MKFEDFAKGFDFLLDSFLRWIEYVRNPTATIQNIVDLSTTDNDAIKRVANLFLTPFIISLLLQSWVYQLYGVGLSNVGLHISFAFFAFLILIAGSISLHIAFKLFKTKIPFKETLITYSVYISTYSPFFALLASPNLALLMDSLIKIKTISPTIEYVPALYLESIKASENTGLGVISLVCFIITAHITLVILSLVLDSLSLRFQLDRERIFSAGSFAFILHSFITFSISLLMNLILYAHL